VLKRKFFSSLFLLSAVYLLSAPLPALSAEETSCPGLYRYKLENGLELYVYRDQALPIARVEICFRAGAIVQTEDNAGIFALYVRSVMGSSQSGSEKPAIKAALSELGAGGWKGGAANESVSFSIKVPSGRVNEALDFWAERLRPASFDAESLEDDKEAAVADIKAAASNPAIVYRAAINRRLFRKYPWRLSAKGRAEAIQALTPAALEKIRDSWFIPNNAALFVAGDVAPEEVFAAASQAFAGWKAGPNPWQTPPAPQARPGVVRPTWVAYADSGMPEGMAEVELNYRAPDLGGDIDSSYTATLWTELASNLSGRFITGIKKAIPKLVGDTPVGVVYLPSRDSGQLRISASFDIGKNDSPVSMAQSFKERARGFEVTTMRSDPSYFSVRDYEEAKRSIINARKRRLETSDGLVDELAGDWAAVSADYFFGYEKAIQDVSQRDVSSFLQNYILRNLEIVALRLNPADFQNEKKRLVSNGFEIMDAHNAFWWQK